MNLGAGASNCVGPVFVALCLSPLGVGRCDVDCAVLYLVSAASNEATKADAAAGSGPRITAGAAVWMCAWGEGEQLSGTGGRLTAGSGRCDIDFAVLHLASAALALTLKLPDRDG